jgi:hypothetical protein
MRIVKSAVAALCAGLLTAAVTSEPLRASWPQVWTVLDVA